MQKKSHPKDNPLAEGTEPFGIRSTVEIVTAVLCLAPTPLRRELRSSNLWRQLQLGNEHLGGKKGPRQLCYVADWTADTHVPICSEHQGGQVPAGSRAQPRQCAGYSMSKTTAYTKTLQRPTGRGAQRPHSPAGDILTHMMQPMDHISTSKLCPFLPSTSGAM